jgi:inosine-uridine nucleoside N-ribohydrolase
MKRFAPLWLGALLMTSPPTADAGASAKIPVILDTDIGSDVDDAFALALALASPELDVRAITTVGSQADARAGLVGRFLASAGLGPVPLGSGRPPQPELAVDRQVQYGGPAAGGPPRPAVALMAATLRAGAGKTTVLALGPLTNVARLLKEHPELHGRIERIVVMGGSVRRGYEGKAPPEVEWNIKGDVAAARAVFEAGLPLTVVPLDATATVRLDRARRERLFAARTALTAPLQDLYGLWGKETPVLYDPVAVAAVFEPRFCTWQELHLRVDEKGMTVVGSGRPNARVALDVRADEFLDWYVDRVRRFAPR